MLSKEEREAIEALCSQGWEGIVELTDIVLGFREMVPAVLDALDEAEAKYNELGKEFNEIADGLYNAHKAKRYLSDCNRLKARAEALESDLINAQMNLGIMTHRAEDLERALRIYGGCCVCVHSDGTGLACDIGGKCGGKSWQLGGVRLAPDTAGGAE